MDPNQFDALARKAAGTRRATLRAAIIGAFGTIVGISGAEAGKRKRTKRKKKEKCSSRCEGRCCKKGTKAALFFPEDGFGCKCCPKERIWRSSTEGKRCCPAGTRAVVGFSTNDGPCCPEKQYCDGECCNDGYVCEDGECVEETCVVSTWIRIPCAEGASEDTKCCFPGYECVWSSHDDNYATCCHSDVVEGHYCGVEAG